MRKIMFSPEPEETVRFLRDTCHWTRQPMIIIKEGGGKIIVVRA
jgi:hypothetical protein